MNHNRFRRIAVSVAMAVGFVGAVIVPAQPSSASTSSDTSAVVRSSQHQMRPADWWWG